VGTLITFNLTNDARLEAEPARVNAGSASSNLTVSEWLRNSGAEPVIPEGVAAFLNSSGKLVAKISFSLPQRLLPGERLEFDAECPNELPAGTYKVLCSFQYEGRDMTNATTFDVP